MANTNNFKAFALEPNANVTAQEEWEALPALLSGFTAGKASSAQVNKALRQSTTIAALIGQFIANSGVDALDNADVNGLVTKFTNALIANLGLVEPGNTSGKLALIGNVNTDTNKCAVVTKTGSNANGRYRIWSDGTIEQWGTAVANSSGNASVNYPIALPGAAQTITTTPLILSNATPLKVRVPMVVTDLTSATKITFLVMRADGTTSADGFYWSAQYAPF